MLSGILWEQPGLGTLKCRVPEWRVADGFNFWSRQSPIQRPKCLKRLVIVGHCRPTHPNSIRSKHFTLKIFIWLRPVFCYC